MDTVQAIVQIIQSVGFPIVGCGALFWYMIKQRDVHKDEMDKMTTAINNNTQVLTQIITMLGGKDNDV